MCPAPHEDNGNDPTVNNHRGSSSSTDDDENVNENEVGVVSYEQMGYALIQANEDTDALNGDYVIAASQNGTSLFDNDSSSEDTPVEVSGAVAQNGNGAHIHGDTAIAASTSDPLSFRDLDRMTEFELGSRSGGSNNAELWAPVRDNAQVELWNTSAQQTQTSSAAGMTDGKLPKNTY